MKKGLFYISLISLLILGWAGTANAFESSETIKATITVSPNPAKPIKTVTVNFNARSDSQNEVTAVQLTVDGAPKGPLEPCEKIVSISGCTTEFQITDLKKGSYKISGKVIFKDGVEQQLYQSVTLVVSESGDLPAPAPSPTEKTLIIGAIILNPAAMGSTIEIPVDEGKTKLNFCSNVNLDISKVTIYFRQDSQQTSAGPFAEGQGSSCTNLKVVVPYGLNVGKAVVFVNNTGGTSNSVDLTILPFVDTPWETASWKIPETVDTDKSKLQINWPKSPIPPNMKLDEKTDIAGLIRYLYEWGISLGGLAAFVALVAAGFKYLTSAGDPGKMREAMNWVKSASLGLVLLFSSVLILNTINPQLTALKMPPLPLGKEKLKINIAGDFTSTATDCAGAILYSGEDRAGKSVSVPVGTSSFSDLVVKSIDLNGDCLLTLYQFAEPIVTDEKPPLIVTGDVIKILGETVFKSATLTNLAE